MPIQYPMNPYPMQTAEQQQRQDLNMLLNAAKTGAIVGSAGAAAANVYRIRQQEIKWRQALANTVKAGFSAGVATATATAVGRLFAPNTVLSLTATLMTGTAVMYALSNPAKEKDNE